MLTCALPASTYQLRSTSAVNEIHIIKYYVVIAYIIIIELNTTLIAFCVISRQNHNKSERTLNLIIFDSQAAIAFLNHIYYYNDT